MTATPPALLHQQALAAERRHGQHRLRLYPTHSDSTCLTGDGARGWKNYNGYTDTTFRPGLWYVMPVQKLDHIQFIGGMLNGSILNTHALYRDIVQDIYSTYP